MRKQTTRTRTDIWCVYFIMEMVLVSNLIFLQTLYGNSLVIPHSEPLIVKVLVIIYLSLFLSYLDIF